MFAVTAAMIQVLTTRAADPFAVLAAQNFCRPPHQYLSVDKLIYIKCGELMMPHRVCKACGSYNKKEIIAQD